MLNNMSLDRVEAFTWIFVYKCSVNQIINQYNHLVCKDKNKNLTF